MVQIDEAHDEQELQARHLIEFEPSAAAVTIIWSACMTWPCWADGCTRQHMRRELQTECIEDCRLLSGASMC